jgi:sugar-specific transcriptional regulator TrmB
LNIGRDEVNTLVGLGLTNTQAKVYLTLAKLENSTVKSIAEASGTNRSDVYRIIKVLQSLGIVDEIVTAPVTFRAISVSECTQILLKRMSKTYDVLKSKTDYLKRKYELVEKHTALPKDFQLVVITGKERLLLIKKREIELAKQTLDVFLSCKEFANLFIIEDLKKALKRGVTIRVLLEKNGSSSIATIFKELNDGLEDPVNNDNTCYKVQSMQGNHEGLLIIVDNRRILLKLENEYEKTAPTLYSDNPILTTYAQNYFESHWTNSKATKINKKNKVHLSLNKIEN